MKVLWVCNLIPKIVAGTLGLETIPKEGWTEGMLSAICDTGRLGRDLEIIIAAPGDRSVAGKSGNIEDVPGCGYYIFYEDTRRPEEYEESMEESVAAMLSEVSPDMVHVFGTEFAHTLAVARMMGEDASRRLMISIQGICTKLAEKYDAFIPESVLAKKTFRDVIKKDGVSDQKEKFTKRGIHERESLKLAGYIAGRTSFDREFASSVNPGAEYIHAGEVLRPDFYNTREIRKRTGHRIFVSQADYPIKGFHILLEALRNGKDGERLPDDTLVYVSGQNITKYGRLIEKIKISGYGKYLRDLSKKNGLEDRVHFLGRIDAAKTVEMLNSSDLFVCASVCENSSNSLGEAMLAGIPVVSTNAGGLPDMMNASEGILCDIDNAKDIEEAAAALREAILKAFDDTDGAYDRCLSAREHAKKSYSRENNAETLIRTYFDIVK